MINKKNIIENMRICPIDEQEYESLIKEIVVERQISVLLGSGISTWSPTEVPNGLAIVNSLAENLVPNEFPSYQQLREYVNHTAFEHIFERCPNHDKVRVWIAEHFSGEKPNEIHNAIAELVKRGIILHVYTTNYDIAMDNALTNAGVVVNRIIGKNDVWNPDEPSLIKLHGSVDNPSSLIFALRHESLMEPWKRNILQQGLKNRILLVCGYSGMDFELSPELVHCNCKKIIWNTFHNPISNPEHITANTSRVILQTDGTILAGNMVRLWTKLLGRQISVTKPLLTSNLADYLFAKLSLSEIQIWRATLMVGIGFPKAAEFAIQSYLETSYSQPLSGYITSLVGQSLFHKGKYLSASRKFFEAAKLYAIEGNLVASLKEKLREVDSLRCYGAYFRAKKLLISVDNESTGLIDDGLNGMVARHKVLMFKQKFDLLSTFKMSRKSRKITTETKPILKYAYKLALINGNWHDIQMCEMWANRMKIPLSEIADGVISPLPSREGFTQIGYFVGKWMALRDIAIHEKDNGKYLLELNESLFETIALGNDPETWKLSFLLITKSRLRFFNNIYYFLKGFYSCEYNIFFRFFLILRAFVTNSV